MSTPTPERAANTATPWRLLFLLMAMTSIGPTTLNVVVPALPQMANRLASDVATIQLAVTVYLLALAGGPARHGTAVGPLRPPPGDVGRADADSGRERARRSWSARSAA